MEKFSFDSLDIKLLWYFSVVAEEGSLRGAAKRLNMSQPPLSLHIKNLEERLGVVLFLRHNRGLTLTGSGAGVLELIRPLMDMQERLYARLASFSRNKERDIAIGLTTGFEQGIFWGMEARLRGIYGERVRFVRESSNPLVQRVRKGKLDVALIALPFDTHGLISIPLPYSEARVLALPDHWPEAGRPGLTLEELCGKPLFRLSRDHNPYFFSFTKDIFGRRKFKSEFVEEPPEHAIVLARIASGEAMGLFPVSFTALERKGEVYQPVAESNLLRAQLAIVALPANEQLLEEVRSEIINVIPPSRLI